MKFRLKNGADIPAVGFGTWQMASSDAPDAVADAVRVGYRHIDCASIYENEKAVGKGLARAFESGVARDELFITSKVWNSDRGYDTTLRALERTLGDLGLEYLDLYLIHWPANAKQFENWREINDATWRALVQAQKDGKVRAIGLSNFLPHHIEPLMDAQIQPMVNQIEFHPGFLQSDVVQYCKEREIVVEAWSPLGSGRVLQDATLGAIAQKHGKSVAQICIRFCLQSGVVALPKSVTPARIAENLAVFDFALDADDMNKIAQMPEIGYSGLHPDKVDF